MDVRTMTPRMLMIIAISADGAEENDATGVYDEINRRYGEGANDRYSDYVMRHRMSHTDMYTDINDNWLEVEKVLRGDETPVTEKAVFDEEYSRVYNVLYTGAVSHDEARSFAQQAADLAVKVWKTEKAV